MFKSSARRRPNGVCAAAVAGLLVAFGGASSASAHGLRTVSSPGSKTSSEQKLRTLENRLIGPRHAAEHAAQRAVRRDPRERARMARVSRTLQARTRRVRASAVNDPASARDGRWAPPVQLPSVAVHAALLSTGKVLYFGKGQRVILWDPKTNASRDLDPPRTSDGAVAEIFCAGQSSWPTAACS